MGKQLFGGGERRVRRAAGDGTVRGCGCGQRERQEATRGTLCGRSVFAPIGRIRMTSARPTGSVLSWMHQHSTAMPPVSTGQARVPVFRVEVRLG